jgi:hypothetical protein
MKRFLSLSIMVTLATCVLATPRKSVAQQTTKTSSTTTTPAGGKAPVDVAKIINAVSTKETQFREALNQYGFTREVVVQTIGMGGQVTGEFRRTSSFAFDDKGNRFEKVMFAPAPTLTDLIITKEDMEDLGGIQPYAL